MAEDADIYFTKKKYVHKCSLPKAAEAIDDIIPDEYYFRKTFRKFCLVSWNVAHRQIYTKSSRVLDKERRNHLLNHYYLIHPFSDFSYYWGMVMIITHMIQLLVAPILIMKRIIVPVYHYLLLITEIIGNCNIIIQFNTGYYRNDIKVVINDRRQIAMHYLKTLFIFDLVGNIPYRSIFGLKNISVIVLFRLAIACNAVNFIKCLETLRQKRDLDLVVVRIISIFAIGAIGLLWISALCSIAANLDQNETCKGNVWWLLYLNFMTIVGAGLSYFCFTGYEIYCKAFALTFGFVIRNIFLVQLILCFKTYFVNRVKKSRLMKEINEFCCLKKLPYHQRTKLFKYYEFKFQNVYYNECDIWELLSESMRQNILDYDAKQWFEGDIFKLCPSVLRQMITMNIDKEIYLKGDVIYLFDDPLTQVYFIKSGQVVLYDGQGNLAFIIGEGNFFSENALLLEDGIYQECKAVADENCQLFSLKMEVFENIIKNFPEEYNMILDILKSRQKYLLKKKHIHERLKLSDYYYYRESEDGFNFQKSKDNAKL